MQSQRAQLRGQSGGDATPPRWGGGPAGCPPLILTNGACANFLDSTRGSLHAAHHITARGEALKTRQIVGTRAMRHRLVYRRRVSPKNKRPAGATALAVPIPSLAGAVTQLEFWKTPAAPVGACQARSTGTASPTKTLSMNPN